MSEKSNISWTDATWSPVTGCDPISAGCKNCYAKREVEQRWSKNPKSVFFGRAFNDVQCHESALSQPLSWKQPKKIFICPRSDLFHDDVPFEFIDRVFAVMALAKQHTFQVLTKRPERMREYLSDLHPGSKRVLAIRTATAPFMALAGNPAWAIRFPLPNVWLGVSVEDQDAANERIPLLLDTPAAMRWISAEPLLGPVDLRHLNDGKEVDEIDSLKPWTWEQEIDTWRNTSETWEADFSDYYGGTEVTDAKGPVHNKIDWVVVGGESGPKARPMSPDWARSLRKQCADSGVPFYFKQWGEWIPMLGQRDGVPVKQKVETTDGWVMGWAGTKAAGRLLDGVLHDAYPEVR